MNSEVIILPAMFGAFGFVVWVVASAWQRNRHIEATMEFNARLVDRIGSVKDFNEFLQTGGGAKFMDTLTVDRGALSPRDRILRTTQTGIITIAVALGLIFVGRLNITSDEYHVLTAIGVIALSLGVGCLAAATASYRLAGVLGLIDGNRRHSDVQRSGNNG